MTAPEVRYNGFRSPADGRTLVFRQHGCLAAPLPLRLDLRAHSPTGFEWGYHGSGPAQLALALLADCLGCDRLAQRLYQPLKAHTVALLPHHRWTLTGEDILAALRAVTGTHPWAARAFVGSGPDVRVLSDFDADEHSARRVGEAGQVIVVVPQPSECPGDDEVLVRFADGVVETYWRDQVEELAAAPETT